MNPYIRMQDNEKGSVMIVVVVLILVILTILGITASRTSIFERQIAANDQLHKISFSASESGAFTMSKLISSCINDGVKPVSIPSVSQLPANSSPNSFNAGKLSFDQGIDNFFAIMMGYTAVTLDNTIDVTLQVAENVRAILDLERYQTSNVVGGGAEFATGSMGAGSGSVGGVQLNFGMTSEGQASRNAVSKLGITYRKVIGVAGGL